MLSGSVSDNYLHEEVPFSIISAWLDKNVLGFFQKEKTSKASDSLLQKNVSYIYGQLNARPMTAVNIVEPVIERKNTPPIDIPGVQLRKSQERDSDEESEKSEDSPPVLVGIYTEKKSSQKIMDTFNWWRDEKTRPLMNEEDDLIVDDAVEPVVIKSFGGSYKRPF